MGFPCGSAGKESACNAGDLGSIPGLGKRRERLPPGEEKGYPLQYSGLENSMDCMVHAVTESDMTGQLSLHFTWNPKSSHIVMDEILGTRVHPWWIHVDVWQNQYNIVK